MPSELADSQSVRAASAVCDSPSSCSVIECAMPWLQMRGECMRCAVADMPVEHGPCL
jgi:hypothetical protein